MDDALRQGRKVTDANVGGSCNVTSFDGIDPNTHLMRSNDVTLAYNLVKTPSSDVLNNVGLYIGASFLF